MVGCCTGQHMLFHFLCKKAEKGGKSKKCDAKFSKKNLAAVVIIPSMRLKYRSDWCWGWENRFYSIGVFWVVSVLSSSSRRELLLYSPTIILL